ncbi:uncharacterized protein [Ptychodera flava]|uniref:uncharacterized protein n=1 Tax=Ptychodera flava TaxID=63121 RepID=UPI00396A3572
MQSVQMEGSAALFVTSWKRNSYGPTNWKMITDFCGQTLKKSELSAIYCTLLDVELSEEQREDAARHGVTLMPARRPKWSKPDEDPPAIHWLLNHNNYYPGLAKLEGITHVVGLFAKTHNAASAIHESLFQRAKRRLVRSKPAALFVGNSWNKDGLGLTGFHRTLVQDFCERKAKAGEDLKAYSTVLDVKISDAQKIDAESCGVTLIPAQRNEKADDTDDPPKLEWLLNHEIYYPDLQELENVQYVIGYAPKTGLAAANIRAKLFPGAKLVLINHARPERNCLQAEEYGLLKFEWKMLKMASEADILFSIGPWIYGYFENKYRAKINGKDLSVIPHEEILPRPNECFLQENPKDGEITQHHILTCGQIDTQEAIERCKNVAVSIGTAANKRKALYKSSPEWKIQGVSQQAGKNEQKSLADATQSRYIYPTLQPGHSTESLLTSLQQSHLCLPSPCYWDYSFYGLEAMAFGLPTSVNEDSHLAYFVVKYLEMHVDDCVVRIGEEKLSEKISRHLEETSVAFKKAKAVKTAFKLINCEAITRCFEKFPSLLKEPVQEENQDGCKKEAAKHFLVKVALNEEILQKRLRELEEQDQAPSVQIRQQQERKNNEMKAAWGECEQELKRSVQAVLADEDSCNEVKKVCKENVGLIPTTVGVGCLGIPLKIFTLYYLYRVKQTCRSRSLAKALEPLLITDEMREIAAKVELKLQLKAAYDTERFEKIERFFINRDGGGVQPVTFHDEIEDDGCCNLDSKDEEPPQASDQVVVTASDKVVEQVSQTNLEQKVDEKLIALKGEPIKPITVAQESQARSSLPIKPSKQQLTDSDIRLASAESKVQSLRSQLGISESKIESLQSQLGISESKLESLQSQLDKACTEKQILEIQLAEAVHEKSQLEKQCQEYLQLNHSAEKAVSTQLSDIHALKAKLERLDPKNIENLHTKLQEKDKVITELKMKLSELSDAQSDIELQKKIAESLQFGEQTITSETVEKETTMASVDDIYIKPEFTDIAKDDPTQPENTGKKGFEMKTATSTQPEMTGREGSEMETATSTQPEMTVRDRSEMKTATSSQPEMTVREGSEMETATPTQPEMTGREGSEMETATPTQPEMTVREGSEMETATPTQPEMTVREGSEIETATPTQPEMTGREGSEMKTATSSQPEMTGREGSEMETATSSQPEMTVREGSEIETATPTQPEMTVREGSEMETATPTQPEMTGREGSEMETATSSQPEMTVREGSEMETATATQPEMTDREGREMETATSSQPEMTVREGSEIETATPTQPEMTGRERHEEETVAMVTTATGHQKEKSDSGGIVSRMVDLSSGGLDKTDGNKVISGSKRKQRDSISVDVEEVPSDGVSFHVSNATKAPENKQKLSGAATGTSESEELWSGPVSSEMSGDRVKPGGKQEQSGKEMAESGELSSGPMFSEKMCSGPVTPKSTKGQSGSLTAGSEAFSSGPVYSKKTSSGLLTPGTQTSSGPESSEKKSSGPVTPGSKKEQHGSVTTAGSREMSSSPVSSKEISSGPVSSKEMSSGPVSSEKKSSGPVTPRSKKEQHGSVTTAGSGEMSIGPVSSKEMFSGPLLSKMKSSSPVTPESKKEHHGSVITGSGELSTDSDSSKKMSSGPVSSEKKSSDPVTPKSEKEQHGSVKTGSGESSGPVSSKKKFSSPVTPGSKKDQHGSVTTAGSGELSSGPVPSKEMSSGPVSSEKISSGLVTTGSKKEQRGTVSTGSGELSAGSQSSKKMSSGQVTPRRTKGESSSGTTRGKELHGGPGSSEMSSGTVIHRSTEKKRGSDGDGSDKTSDHSKSKEEIPVHGGTATASSKHEPWSRRTLKGHQGQIFKDVRGLAFHNDKLLVCDNGKNIVHILNQDYTCEKELGSFSGQLAKPFKPVSIAVSQDNLYFILDDSNVQIVVCAQNNEIIRIITLPTDSDPWCIALVKGFVIVTEIKGHRVLKYSQNGHNIAQIGGYGDSQTQFKYPYFVAVNSSDVIMVSDSDNHCIKCFDAQFNFLYQYGQRGDSNGQLYQPLSIAVDGADHVYGCDGGNARISMWSGDGTWRCHLFQGELGYPWYMAVTADGDRIAVRGGLYYNGIVVFSK